MTKKVTGKKPDIIKVSQAEMDLRTHQNELVVKLKTLETQAKNVEADYHRIQGAIELLKNLLSPKGEPNATDTKTESR